MRLKKGWCFRTQLILIVADIFHVVRGGLGGGAVNHSESGQGGQAPLTLCTVGGGYLTWD